MYFVYRIAVVVFLISSVLSTSAIPTVVVVIGCCCFHLCYFSLNMMQILIFHCVQIIYDEGLKWHHNFTSSAVSIHTHTHNTFCKTHHRCMLRYQTFHVFYCEFQIPSINFMTLIGLINSINSFIHKYCLDVCCGSWNQTNFLTYEFINKLFAGILP